MEKAFSKHFAEAEMAGGVGNLVKVDPCKVPKICICCFRNSGVRHPRDIVMEHATPGRSALTKGGLLLGVVLLGKLSGKT